MNSVVDRERRRKEGVCVGKRRIAKMRERERVCVCMCVRERDRGREREGEKGRKRKRRRERKRERRVARRVTVKPLDLVTFEPEE